jgi:hypothetical protein
MKKQLHVALILLGMSFIILAGCKKEHGLHTTITLTLLESPELGVETGTLTATGGLTTSGTFVMVIEPVGADSIHCTTTNTTAEGTFITILNCSLVTNEGKWFVESGTGAYKFLQGTGTLLMRFPPDPQVPAGSMGTETQTGIIWFQ